MSRNLFGVELGLEIMAENADTGVSVLKGPNAPGGDTAEQDNALQGSLFLRENGEMYIKKAAGTGTDKWKRMSDADDLLNLSWRSETVRAATNDTLAVGLSDPSGYSDNESGLDDTDFAVGEFIIGDADGTPVLYEITSISSPNLTLALAADPLSDNDSLIVRSYLPDAGATQENQAILLYNGSSIIKLADVDWNFADGINIAAGYAASAGDVTSSDSVQTAIQKLDGNLDNATLILGRDVQSDVDMGAYTGTILTDNEDVKTNIQELETALDLVSGGSSVQSAGVTTVVTLDSVLVDDVLASEWEIHMVEDASPTNIKVEKVIATHNGHAGADASAVDDSAFAKLKIGSAFDAVVLVELNGVGAAQVMRLQVSSSTAGVTFTARRTDITAP